ncbi:hypothetical protein BFP76_03185 [Amylibacter kogurei]|uniref:Urease accessory protein UreF n=1 Tax=Paramylibacter kogurei TaxID=1889778 RepID=A0A2G5K3Y6_9RHOB|nr:urease accessory protein UreF [Amylibacter kogurei]PIB24241.1 hypothetical protein BFP76_03185 [Amylibacter kogurei]
MSTNSAHKLLAWLSPSYPIGAYSYSHGLEYAIDAGDVHDAHSLQIWLSDVLQYGAGRNDAILLAHAYRADGDALTELCDLAIALSPSAERHLETTAQGAAFAKVTSAITGHDISAMPLPVALGVAARREDVPLNDLIPLYLHSFAANIIAAGVRFIPLGQTDGQRVLHALFDQIDDIAKQAETASLDDLGSACFWSDIASMKHENMTTRIFRT